MNRKLFCIGLLLLLGCTQKIERPTSAETFVTSWLGPVPSSEMKGYTIDGLRPGQKLAAIKAVPFELERSLPSLGEGAYTLTDSKTGVVADLTFDDSGTLVLIHTNRQGSLEKDGKLLLRTGDPPEIARGALGGGPEQTNLLESDGEARLEVIVNHRGV